MLFFASEEREKQITMAFASFLGRVLFASVFILSAYQGPALREIREKKKKKEEKNEAEVLQNYDHNRLLLRSSFVIQLVFVLRISMRSMDP